ncbi:LysR family transcriptional regulator [Sphingomonas alpina]|uniref:LysR family transcriptional regulator n=2 Tax=Sphingomonas alpina TaxID=653931 RepID=A0A7H0LQK1_9SPHN|nr:LysR family transcriptional regulator [Sphingomonas alpina]
MEVSQLRAFVTLADLQHFGRAADRLHITQPALTKRLQALEARIGARLFERDRTGTALTPVGKALVADAARIVADAEAWSARARAVVNGIEGRLDIGFGLSTIDLAPRLVGAFRRAYPTVAVSLNDFSSSEQIERLRDGRLDLGFVRFPVPAADIASRPLMTGQLALASFADGAGTRGTADLQSLNEIGFILIDRTRGPGLRAQIDRWCDLRRFAPRIIQTADDIQTVLALVAAGVGVSIVPHQAARLMGESVALEPLSGAEAEWSLGAAWRSGASNPALRNFLGLMDSMAGVAGPSAAEAS